MARTARGRAIARLPSIVIDCADPGALAAFYGAILDWKADVSPGWAEVRAEYGQCISFQQVEAYTPPRWPAQEVPQQMHLDVAEGGGARSQRDQARAPARYVLPGVPRSGGAPLLPLRGLTRGGARLR